MHKSSVRFGKKKSEVRFGFGKKFQVRSLLSVNIEREKSMHKEREIERERERVCV